MKGKLVLRSLEGHGGTRTWCTYFRPHNRTKYMQKVGKGEGDEGTRAPLSLPPALKEHERVSVKSYSLSVS